MDRPVPHLSRIIDVGQTPDTEGNYPVTEDRMSGSTVGQLFDDNALTVEQIVSLGLRVARVLADCHQQGVVIGGSLNDAVLIGENNSLEVSLVAARTASGTIADEQRPPETLLGEPWSEAADRYILGMLIHRLITRQSPWPSGTMGQLDDDIVSHPPLPIEVVTVNSPAGLGACVESLLAKEPAMRFRSTPAMVSELERIVATMMIDSHGGEESDRSPWPQRILIGVIVVCLIGLLIVAIGRA